jgi:uncharacterized membrane protein
MHPRTVFLAALILAAALPFSLPARPSADTSVGKSAASDTVQPVEVIQEVTPADSAGHNGFLLKVGRFHALVVHFPIAWLLLLVLFELAILLLGKEEWRLLSFYLLTVTLLSFIPAACSGLANASQRPGPDPEFLDLMHDHRNLMLTAAGIVLAAFILRLKFRRQLSGKWRWLYLLLVLAAAGVTVAGARLGGEMVYGTNYFPF